MTSSKRETVKHIIVNFVTNGTDDLRAIKDSLGLVYPRVDINRISSDSDEDAPNADIRVVNASCLSQAGLESMLESPPDMPEIVVVADAPSLQSFAKFLTGDRAVIARSALHGIGLVQAAHHLLEKKGLREELSRASKHIKELSIRDELTGFINNRHFHEVLSTEVKKATRYKRPLSLAMLSIKNISELAATLGHVEAERIISKSAEAIRGSVRNVDIPARNSEGEFAIVLPESDEQAAKIVAKRVQEVLEDPSFIAVIPTRLVMSIGVAALSASVKSKEDLLRTATFALTEAKRSGENTICTSEDMEAKKRGVRENRQLIDQLGERLSRIAFEAQRGYFQSLMRAIGEMPVLKKMLLPHSERVAFFGKRLAEAIGLEETRYNAVYRAGLLHDCGKLAIDAAIISKPERLTLPEQELMQKHPLFATQILGKTPFLSEELSAILYHHERFDGEGYPEHISGDSIPLSARILAIAEAWDVMTTPQPYRAEPLTLNKALAEVERGAGTQFDPELVKCFSALISG